MGIPERCLPVNWKPYLLKPRLHPTQLLIPMSARHTLVRPVKPLRRAWQKTLVVRTNVSQVLTTTAPSVMMECMVQLRPHLCFVKSVGTPFTRNVSSNVGVSTHLLLKFFILFICYFSLGQRTAASNGKELTCVWCRARWIVARPSGGATGGVKRSMGAYGYINLSDVAGVSPVRDTSTCKRGIPFSYNVTLTLIIFL